MTKMHLNTLKKILAEEKKKHLFPCIKDLVVNGLTLERFPDGNAPPSRQDITQYLAAWCRYIGMDSDTCLEWMIEYCTHVLSVLSSSSKSRIRHSTKGNVKYIYKSEVKFECTREENPFKAHCNSQCLVYEKMGHVVEAKKKSAVVPFYERAVDSEIDNELPEAKPSIKEIYKEQFEKALTVISDCLDQDLSRKRIVTLLNKRDFKTRTGKKWSYSTLANEIKELKSNG